MISIIPATDHHISILVELGQRTFIQSHGHSAPKKEIDDYVRRNYTEEKIKVDLLKSTNQYYLFLVEDKPIGFSNIIMDCPISAESLIDEKDHELLSVKAIAKLDRIYLLDEHHGKGYAQTFFNFQVELARKANQKAMWLYVWVQNYRAIGFYEKMNFRPMGRFEFEISPVHRNPNWVMYREIE